MEDEDGELDRLTSRLPAPGRPDLSIGGDAGLGLHSSLYGDSPLHAGRGAATDERSGQQRCVDDMGGRTQRHNLPPSDSLQGRWGPDVTSPPLQPLLTGGHGHPHRSATAALCPPAHPGATSRDSYADRLSSLEGSLQHMRHHFLQNNDELGQAASAGFGSRGPSPQLGAAAPLR
eukprot:GHVU01026331.1.p1 GENE.GHVU01026331.1~~GHVU01026331.1.p1  ORF type:complete len:203 (+),score=17.68 GHVU01026331.1:87-611(+)